MLRPHLLLNGSSILPLLLLLLLVEQAQSIYEPQVPMPFDDTQLVTSRPVSRQWIEHLGSVIKLDCFHVGANTPGATRFSIYTRRKSTENITFQPNELCFPGKCYGPYQYDLDAIQTSGFNASARTVIMISGFLTDDRVGWMDRTKDLWLQLDDVNVILVTWKDSNRYLYNRAVSETPLVARQIVIFLYYLAALNGHQLHTGDHPLASNIHFIGHSLGAHIGGFVGQELGGRVSRITGLDPAGPTFDLYARHLKLDVTDARLVDVIHTNAGKIRYLNAVGSAVVDATDSLVNQLPLVNQLSVSRGYSGEGDTAWFGIDEQTGHLDYYANGGRVQPGCLGLMHTCDHARSTKIYEDILRRELELRRYAASTDTSWLKSNRLLAFSSLDYDSFLTGKNLNLQCPALLVEETESSFKQCSVPIDLTTWPVDVLIDELESEYHVNVRNYRPNNKYYFKTNPQQPLVGDHYLFKVLLDRSTTSWDLNCALRAEVRMADGSSQTMELNREFPLVTNGIFFGVAMPFVNPRGTEARDALNKILMSPRMANQSQLTGAILWPVTQVMPVEVSLTVSRADSTGLLEAVKNKLVRVLRLGGSPQAPASCQLGIISIEIHPLIPLRKRSVAAVYGSSLPPDGLSLRLMTLREHANQLLMVIQAGNPFRAMATRDSIFTRKLDGIVME